MPQFTHERYIKRKATSPYEIWRFSHQQKSISNKKALRIEVMTEAIIHWTDDDWLTSNNLATRYSGLGVFVGDIFQKNEGLDEIIFTFFWKDAKRWENKNFVVKVSNQEMKKAEG